MRMIANCWRGTGWIVRLGITFISAVFPLLLAAANTDPAVQELAKEVHNKGWIIYGARSAAGDWDLFYSRPDGSDVRAATQTPEFNEFSPRVSPDGKKLLYRRIRKAEIIDNNRHGEQGELVIANSDGSSPEVYGKTGEMTWAVWGPDAKQVACLSIKGISIVDLSTRKVVRTIPRKGFFQQLAWSPDGLSFCGVANSLGAAWSIGRMELAKEEIAPVNTVDCCTPDWFPDSKQIIFSWRPRGQGTNKDYGWTQLWRADADGKNRQLVYGEDGRHVYGGQVSPDAQYVLFTGNMSEDGDPGHSGGPMGLMRLKDGPIIGGESKALRQVHRNVHDGPVLVLPAGWEPHWTSFEIFGSAAPGSSAGGGVAVSIEKTTIKASGGGESGLAKELHDKGWIAFSAQTAGGDWDLFAIRPDGSDRRNITATPEWNEAGARFSPDGTQLLYFRMPKSEAIDNNNYGTFDLILARADGTKTTNLGKGFNWASWSSDGRQLSCLKGKSIQIVEITSRAVVREMPRLGFVSQLIWSPDGKRFVGTANGLGPFWNIGCMDLESGKLHAVSETDRFNCTPDWTPDGGHITYARGIIPPAGGRAELWIAQADGTKRKRVYAEESRHIYGSCASPDGKYLLFTRSSEDLGKVLVTEMAVIRCPGRSLKDLEGLGEWKEGIDERLDLGLGWEPHWTARQTL